MLYADTITWFHKLPEDESGKAFYRAQVLKSVKFEATTGASRGAHGEAANNKAKVYIPVPICHDFEGKLGDVVAKDTKHDAESPHALRVVAIDAKELGGRPHHIEVVLA